MSQEILLANGRGWRLVCKGKLVELVTFAGQCQESLPPSLLDAIAECHDLKLFPHQQRKSEQCTESK
jgi:hypothetical protein